MGLRAALELTAHPVVASGGVRSPPIWPCWPRSESAGPDGRRLAGAIVGTALVEGAMTVEEAIAACAPSV